MRPTEQRCPESQRCPDGTADHFVAHEEFRIPNKGVILHPTERSCMERNLVDQPRFNFRTGEGLLVHVVE
ncbi:hypothetical protein MLD38_024540 [Melastoma candidum]|uniref:Uncharacterized protein n=1 Tax=Melastoma candidum TaxID=119954 RepID=A0ACB9NTK7_9MYRT|nr:hypothetical protein MLD38_024540 [Melastoma candidum]